MTVASNKRRKCSIVVSSGIASSSDSLANWRKEAISYRASSIAGRSRRTTAEESECAHRLQHIRLTTRTARLRVARRDKFQQCLPRHHLLHLPKNTSRRACLRLPAHSAFPNVNCVIFTPFTSYAPVFPYRARAVQRFPGLQKQSDRCASFFLG